jgi:uncharacterized protein (DUF58 family)
MQPSGRGAHGPDSRFEARSVRRPLVTLALAAAFAAASASVASLALFAVASGLVLLTAGAGLAVALAIRRVTVTRDISTREVQENSPIRLRFTVQGATWLPVRFEIEDHSGGWKPITHAGASLEVCVSRRGPHWLAPSRLRLRDAFGIVEWHMPVGVTEPLLILPVPDGRSPMHRPPSTTVGDPEPHGLRPYAPGTPVARIYWPAFARGAGLHVRHFASSTSELPLVVVDTDGAPSDQALDWAARTAAGYILELARGGGCRVLLPGDASETSVTGTAGDWRAVHRRLATLGGSSPTERRTPTSREHVLRVRAAAAPAPVAPAPSLPRGVEPRFP